MHLIKKLEPEHCIELALEGSRLLADGYRIFGPFIVSDPAPEISISGAGAPPMTSWQEQASQQQQQQHSSR